MKTLALKLIALLFLVGIRVAVAQEREKVPGDNFSLEGALELFKKSASPEEFEQMLNAQDSKVNNLDLDGDSYIDYIRVIDRNEGNVHTFTLQAVISDQEFQDVAVIALEKKANGKAVLQIIGDEDIYGMETIIEPTQEVRVNAGTTTTQAVVNVWAWPSVQYVYGPSYSVWVSPWGWYSRPVWWHRWRPVAYYDYYGWWQPYRPYYVRCYSPRIVYAHRIYRPYRTTSVIVHRRHETQITQYRSSNRDYERSRGRYAKTSNNRYDNTARYNGTTNTRRSEGTTTNRTTVRTRGKDNMGVTRTTTRTRNTDQKPVVTRERQRSVQPQSSGSQQKSTVNRSRESSKPQVNRQPERSRSTGSTNPGSKSRPSQPRERSRGGSR